MKRKKWYEDHYDEFVAENPDERKSLMGSGSKRTENRLQERKQMVFHPPRPFGRTDDQTAG